MKRLITLLCLAIFAQVVFGQLTGTKNIPGDYSDLASAIADLNLNGVGSGGVTLNLLAGNAQTAPAGGYVVGGTGSLVLTTSSVSNQVIIQGNGNAITAPTPQTSGNLNDAIFKLIGADWITITGFTMNENASNTTTTAGTNNMTEWGVALLYVTTTDGAKNNTIQNNTITLVRTYQNAFGIYSNVRHSPTAISVAADITNVSGANDNTYIYSNNISNVNNGIVIVGSTTGAYMNTGIDIGGSSLSTANTISNYGATGTFSGYVSVSGSVMGINSNNNLNVNISYNSITCPGLNTAGTVYGVFMQATGTLPTTGGPFTNIVSHNGLSIKSGLTSGTIYGILNSLGNLIVTYDVSYNDCNNFGHTGSGTGTIYGLSCTGGANTQTINYNTFTNLNVNTTGSVYLLHYSNSLPLATSNQSVTNNSIVTGFSKSGAGGTVYGMYNFGTSVAGSTKNITNNNFSNMTVTGSTALIGIDEIDGGTPTKFIQFNTTNNLTGGSGAITGMLLGYFGGNSVVSNNTINVLTGTVAITGMTINTNGAATSLNVHTNSIINLTSSGTGGTVTGLSSASPATVVNIYNNTINSLSTTAATVVGLTSSGATTNIYQNAINTLSTTNASGIANGVTCSAGTTIGIYKNKIYDLSGNQTGTIINGINITAGTTFNISNNLIGDLRATAATGLNAINGINASATATYNVYYNTIYLNASSTSVTTFGNSCITFGSTVTTFNHRNNILVNLSTPAQDASNLAANGIAACLRRSGGTTGTVPANYATTSNNNDFWCNPTAGTNNHLSYVEGTSSITNPQNTVANLIAFMVNRDQASIGENPTFISTTGSNSTFLHINTTAQTGIESGGNNITSYTDDFDNDIRQGNGGYSGTGTAPDIGADEFAGMPSYTCSAPSPGSTVSSANNICLGQSITLSLQNPISGTGNTYQWQSSVNGSSYADISLATSSTYTTTPTASLYYQCVVTCQSGPSSAISTPVQVTFSNNILTTTPGSRCGTGTVNLAATSSGGTLSWYAAATGGSSLGTGSPFTTPTISATTTYFVGAETAGAANVSIGTSTTNQNTTMTWPAPYGNYDENGKHHILILASELNTAGLSAGNLNSLSFDVASVGTSGIHKSFTLSIANTALTVLTTTMESTGFSPVFGPVDYQPVNGLNTHTFSTPFYWNGSSNIIIEVCFTNDATSSGTYYTVNAIMNRTTTSYNSVAYKVADNVAQCPLTASASVSTARPNMVINGTGVCSSPRSSVVATVSDPPALTVSASQTICNNTVATLAVTSAPLSDYDSYTWSPLTGLFIDEPCVTAYTGTSATTVYFKSVTAGVNTFTCTANNSVSGCANTAQSVVTNLPATTVITASLSYLCLSGTSTLTSVPASGYGSATFQWQDSPDNSTFTDITGANAISYTTPTLTSTTYYKLLVKLGTNTCYESNVATVTVSNPQVTGTTPNSRCGIGTVSLEATVTGGSLKWYAASTGGSPLGSGSPFVTPVISATTTFYAGAEAYSPGTRAVGAGATTSATYSNPFYSAWSNNHTQHLIKADELNAAGLSAGNLTSVALDVTSAGTLPMIDLSVKIAQTTATSLTAFLAPSFTTVYTNASMMPVVGLNVLTFSTPFTWDGTSNIVLEFCHGNGSSSATMSRTVKADNTAYNSSIKVHVGAATAAATVCADVTTNLLTYTVRPQFTFGGQTVCSSARSSVLATVTPPPLLTLTSNQAVCNNSVATISITSTLADYDSYVWSPQTNLFTDDEATIEYTGTSVTTVYFKTANAGTYTITCNSSNSVSGCSNIATCDVTNLPATVTVTASPSNHCLSGSSILTAVPATGYGTATFQWQESDNNSAFTDITDANAISYITPTLTSTKYYKLQVKLGTNVCLESNSDTVLINNPQVTDPVPGSRCGIGTVSLGATASEGATLKWFANSSGGTLLGTGSPFTTPSISTTTTFYVEAEKGTTITSDIVGSQTLPTSPSTTTSSDAGIVFTTTAANIAITSARIFVSGSGNITFQLQTSGGTVIATYVAAISGATTSAFTTVNYPSTFITGAAGTGYRLLATAKDAGITWYYPSGTYPYTCTSGLVSITAGWGWGTSSSTDIRCIHNISFNYTVSCVSARTAVLATVSTPPALTITSSQNVCTGSITSMSVTSTETNYETYTWSPVTGLYTDNLCLDPYEAMEDLTTVYVKLSAAGPVVYTCTGAETVNNCMTLTTSTVTGIATPVAPVTTGYSMCLNGTIPSGEGLQSTAVGGTILTGSQTIYFDVLAQPAETNAAPGNIVASATMSAIPASATVTSIVITYNNILALGTSWQSDVKLGFSGSIVNAAAAGTGAANTAGTFNYTRTATTGITSVNAGGTVNLLYWDDVSDNTGDEATFPFALTQDASLVINYSYPDPVAIQWYTTLTGGTALGTGSPFNPIGVDPLLPNSSVAGTYTYYAEVLNGTCASPRTSCDLVIGSAVTTTATADPAIPVCSGTEVTLTANPSGGGTPYTYEWKVGETVVKTIQSFDTTLTATTIFNLKVTDNCTQVATASVTVNVNPIPTTSASSNSPVCAGQTLELYGTPSNESGMTFSWTGPNGFISDLEDPSISNVTTAASGTYSFYATASGCTSLAGTVNVVINQSPSTVVITPSSATIDYGDVQQLVASGGTITTTAINESFTGVSLPSGWSTVVVSPETVGVTATAYAGGTANEITFNSMAVSSSYTGTNRLIYGPVNTSGASSLTLSWKNFLDHFSSSYSYYAAVQTSSDGVNWNNSSWNYNPVTADIAVGTQTTTISTIDVGSSTFYLSFTLSGLLYGNMYWYIDDVVMTGPGSTSITWSPVSGLFTNEGATIPYIEGAATTTVYASPSSTQTYTATATSNLNCTNSTDVTVTVIHCTTPTGLTANGIGIDNANLTWTPGATETNWEYAYGEAPFATPSGAGTATSSNTTNPISGLDPNTDYQFYVRSVCGTNYSGWSSAGNFTTLCADVTTFPYIVGFEGTTWPPACWTDAETADFGWNQSGVDPHTGSRLAYCNLQNSALITPGLVLSSDSRLIFWFRVEDEAVHQAMDVKIGEDVIYPISDANNMTYQEVQVSLAAYTGQTVSISFVGGTGNGENDKGIYLDDVTIRSNTNYWTGNISTEWNNSGNWSAGFVPDQYDRVIIPSSPTASRFPVVPAGTWSCFGLTLESGAEIDILGILNVLNP